MGFSQDIGHFGFSILLSIYGYYVYWDCIHRRSDSAAPSWRTVEVVTFALIGLLAVFVHIPLVSPSHAECFGSTECFRRNMMHVLVGCIYLVFVCWHVWLHLQRRKATSDTVVTRTFRRPPANMSSHSDPLDSFLPAVVGSPPTDQDDRGQDDRGQHDRGQHDRGQDDQGQDDHQGQDHRREERDPEDVDCFGYARGPTPGSRGPSNGGQLVESADFAMPVMFMCSGMVMLTHVAGGESMAMDEMSEYDMAQNALHAIAGLMMIVCGAVRWILDYNRRVTLLYYFLVSTFSVVWTASSPGIYYPLVDARMNGYIIGFLFIAVGAFWCLAHTALLESPLTDAAKSCVKRLVAGACAHSSAPWVCSCCDNAIHSMARCVCCCTRSTRYASLPSSSAELQTAQTSTSHPSRHDNTSAV